MKAYQFFTADGRGGTLLSNDETLEAAVQGLRRRFDDVVRVQAGTETWELADTRQESIRDHCSLPESETPDSRPY